MGGGPPPETLKDRAPNPEPEKFQSQLSDGAGRYSPSRQGIRESATGAPKGLEKGFGIRESGLQGGGFLSLSGSPPQPASYPYNILPEMQTDRQTDIQT